MTDVFGHIGARKETGKGSLSSCLSKAAPHLGSVGLSLLVTVVGCCSHCNAVKERKNEIPQFVQLHFLDLATKKENNYCCTCN